MKKSYYLFLLLLVAATSFSVHAQTGQKFPDFKLGVGSVSLSVSEASLP